MAQDTAVGRSRRTLTRVSFKYHTPGLSLCPGVKKNAEAHASAFYILYQASMPSTTNLRSCSSM